MNDYGNNIILASQAGCDLVLITEEGGDFPVGSKVFYDSQGQTFDVTNTTDGTGLFENNQNIGVDWETDLPNTEKWASMFAGSDIESVNVDKFGKSTFNVTNFNGTRRTFNNCHELKSVCIKNLGIPYYQATQRMICLTIPEWFTDCDKLESVYICFDVVGSTAMSMPSLNLSSTFENCVSLKNITIIHNLADKQYAAILTNAFKGCKFGPEQLNQLLNNVKINPSTGMLNTAIGYDPELVDPNVDKPERSELTWAEAFAEKKWTVTWEAYVEPVENAPKLLKAAKQKLYKLDEVAEEMLDMLGDSTVYVKGGKHYLMTSGDSVTAPGTDGTLLRDTEVENVVRAGSLQEAIDLLGVTLAEK